MTKVTGLILVGHIIFFKTNTNNLSYVCFFQKNKGWMQLIVLDMPNPVQLGYFLLVLLLFSTSFFFYLLFFFNYIIKSEIFIEFYPLLLC
jgi:hypothetical protein